MKDNENKYVFDKEVQTLQFNLMVEEFKQNPNYYEAVIIFKTKFMKQIKMYEEIYSVKMSDSMIKKINRIMNIIINDRAKKLAIYKYYDIMLESLIDSYKDREINNEVSYLKWVLWLKSDYNDFKLEIEEIYPDDKYRRVIKKYDLLIDKLIDDMMNMNSYLYINDENELNNLFANYRKNIVSYDFDKYFDYVSESEECKVKSEMFESKNFQFMKMISNFNDKIIGKYSNRYALMYIDDVNKRVNDLIMEYALTSNNSFDKMEDNIKTLKKTK